MVLNRYFCLQNFTIILDYIVQLLYECALDPVRWARKRLLVNSETASTLFALLKRGKGWFTRERHVLYNSSSFYSVSVVLIMLNFKGLRRLFTKPFIVFSAAWILNYFLFRFNIESLSRIALNFLLNVSYYSSLFIFLQELLTWICQPVVDYLYFMYVYVGV